MLYNTISHNKRKKRFSLSEKGLAYLLIAPALIVILLVAFYPVIQTFYLSLFDMRLNHPTRNETHLVNKVDLEEYADYYIGMTKYLELLETESTLVEMGLSDKIISGFEDFHHTLINSSAKETQYNAVYSKVYAYEQVSEDSLKYLKISKGTAEALLGISKNLKSVVGDSKALLSAELTEREYTVIAQLISSLSRMIVTPNYIGLDNYRYHFQDARMWKSLGNTFTFVGFAVFFELLFGLFIALLINQNFTGRGMLRAAILIPWSIPAAVNGLIWRSMYDGQFGVISILLSKLGLLSSPGIMLSTGSGAMVGLIIADIWKTTPFMALLILGGLQTIDRNLYEAAYVDGAKKFQHFFHITLPLLRNAIIIAVIFRTLDTFRVFDLVYVLTGGGPANATETISVYAYKTMFAQMNFGSGSTLSVIVFTCILLLNILYIKFLDSDMFKDEVK